MLKVIRHKAKRIAILLAPGLAGFLIMHLGKSLSGFHPEFWRLFLAMWSWGAFCVIISIFFLLEELVLMYRNIK